MFWSRFLTRGAFRQAPNTTEKAVVQFGKSASTNSKALCLFAATPLFFTEFKDSSPILEYLYFWGDKIESIFHKTIEPNVDLVYLAFAWILIYRIGLNFGFTFGQLAKQLHLGYGLRWHPGHHNFGPWKAVNHPLLKKK